MKTGLIICWVLLLSACSSGFDPNFMVGFNAEVKEFRASEQPPKNELNLLAEKLVAEMLANNQFVGKQNTIAVTSIVDLADLNTTNRLGAQLSEGLVHYLHSNGFRVVDFKLTGTIQVTPQGDFIHSRDWEQLKSQQAIDYLVSGTLDQYEGGLYLNIRMVSLQSQVVVGSAQTFIPHAQLQGFTSLPEPANNDANKALIEQAATQMMQDKINGQRQLYMDNGFLIRKHQSIPDK